MEEKFIVYGQNRKLNSSTDSINVALSVHIVSIICWINRKSTGVRAIFPPNPETDPAPSWRENLCDSFVSSSRAGSSRLWAAHGQQKQCKEGPLYLNNVKVFSIWRLTLRSRKVRRVLSRLTIFVAWCFTPVYNIVQIELTFKVVLNLALKIKTMIVCVVKSGINEVIPIESRKGG